MDIKNISLNELINLMEDRLHRLKDANIGHPIDNKARLNAVETIFDEIKTRIKTE
jgi:hypothetical protein